MPSAAKAILFSLAALSLLSVAFIATGCGCAEPSQSVEYTRDDVLNKLRPGHPRLRILDSELPDIRTAIDSDELPRKWHAELTAEAQRLTTQPTVVSAIRPTTRSTTRPAGAARQRNGIDYAEDIVLLAGLYRLDGNPQFAEHARQEMLAAAALNWGGPKDFLSVAPYLDAEAIGYDWLYKTLSPKDRLVIRTAIVEKGLKPGLKAYEEGIWWTVCDHNWNQTTNSALTAGALAVAEDEPLIAARVLARTRGAIPVAMANFAPDGGWSEGPSYWGSGTRSNVFYLEDLRTALGTDYGLLGIPGYSNTGMFHIYTSSPIRKSFNFADATEQVRYAPQMFLWARQFNEPAYTGFEIIRLSNHPNVDLWHLLWWNGRGKTPDEAGLPLDAIFRGIAVACFRSSWTDRTALYIGFKGGDNGSNHAHLDLGSFVLDDLGQRWALDLGPDDYKLPDYFSFEDGKRWVYYRVRTEGHNTLTINGHENQAADAKAPLVGFLSSPSRSFAVADLSAAYAPALASARRGIAMLNRNQALVQDEITANSPVDVLWNFHTAAGVEINSGATTAVLTIKDVKLKATILAPAGATFEVISANPNPLPEKQQPDVHNLTVKLPGKVTQATIAVLLQPVDDSFTPELEPLEKWIAAGK